MKQINKSAARLNCMHTIQGANVLLALAKTHGNRYVQRLADEMKLMKCPEAPVLLHVAGREQPDCGKISDQGVSHGSSSLAS